MSDIDIQIAKVLGWKVVETNLVFRLLKPSGEFVRWERTEDEAWSHIPAFSSSIDLMHELEMMIPEEKQYAYYKYVEREVALGDVLFKKYEDSRYAPYRFLVITATAEQRAPAWKKVMGGE